MPAERELARPIADHYAAVDEASRLLTGVGRLEYVRTQELLGRFLPPPPACVLDVGGAAGVHALPLAARGYAVHLLDPVPRHVEEARRVSAEAKHPLAAAAVGEARALPAAEGTVDAVLCLGPLYHLVEREERLAALAEARRVLRPGGVLCAAAISRLASTLDGLRLGLHADPAFRALRARDLAEGQHRNPTGDPGYFTTAFFHHPDELADELTAAELELEGVLAVEGPAWLLGDLDARWDDADERVRILEAVRLLEREPSCLGASAHLLGVARR